LAAIATSSVLIIFAELSINGALWAMAGALGVISGTGLLLLRKMLNDQHQVGSTT